MIRFVFAIRLLPALANDENSVMRGILCTCNKPECNNASLEDLAGVLDIENDATLASALVALIVCLSFTILSLADV